MDSSRSSGSVSIRFDYRTLSKRIDFKKTAENLWSMFNDAFGYMPLACRIGPSILCMHGGISPHLTSLNDIKAVRFR